MKETIKNILSIIWSLILMFGVLWGLGWFTKQAVDMLLY